MMIFSANPMDRLLEIAPDERYKHFDALSELERIAVAGQICRSFKTSGGRFTIVEHDLMIELAKWSKKFTPEFYEKYIYDRLRD